MAVQLVQALAGDGGGGPLGRRVAGHGGQERLPGQAEHDDGGGRGDRGGARDAVQQRDLTRPLAPDEGGDRLAAGGDLQAAVGDGVEAVALVALGDEGVAGRQLDPLQRPGQPSRAGAGSARKSWSERSSAISTIGTWAARSSASRARSPASATSGASTAVPAIAATVPPAATSSGIIAAPTARPAMARPSATPNTRPTTSAGTTHWSSVRVATLSTTCPPPATASRTSAAGALVKIAVDARAPPSSPTPPRIGMASRRRPTSVSPAPRP